MNRLDLLQRLAAPLLPATVSACAPTLPVIVKPVDCPVPAEALTRRRDDPRPLPAPGAALTFADLVCTGTALTRPGLRRAVLPPASPSQPIAAL